MGDMIGHGSWLMSWLAARGLAEMNSVLCIYINNYSVLVATPVFHLFVSMREGGLHTNYYISGKMAGILYMIVDA